MQNNPTPKNEEEPSSTFVYPTINVVNLERQIDVQKVDILKIMEGRRSKREFRNLSIQVISKILWFSAKVRGISVQNNGYILSQRPSASAGARHPIDILVLSPIFNKWPTLQYYNPFEHTLCELKIENRELQDLVDHIKESIDLQSGTILWFLAHPNRTEVKYNNSVSLIWRDAGALIHSVQIACTIFDVNSCPVGTLAEPFISNMFQSYGNTFSAGGIIIG